VRNTFEWILGAASGTSKREARFDLDEAAEILEEDHYGLKRSRSDRRVPWRFQARIHEAQGAGALFRGRPAWGREPRHVDLAGARPSTFVVSLGRLFGTKAEIRGLLGVCVFFPYYRARAGGRYRCLPL